MQRKCSLPFLNVLEHFTNTFMLINFVKAFKIKGSELSLRHALGSFQAFLIFSDLRQTRCSRKIPNPVLETTLITQETTYTLDFGKYFVVSFWSHSIRAFSVLLKDSFRIISET
jgi:hypothetical protein